MLFSWPTAQSSQDATGPTRTNSAALTSTSVEPRTQHGTSYGPGHVWHYLKNGDSYCSRRRLTPCAILRSRARRQGLILALGGREDTASCATLTAARGPLNLPRRRSQAALSAVMQTHSHLASRARSLHRPRLLPCRGLRFMIAAPRGLPDWHGRADAGPGKLPKPLSARAEAFGFSLAPCASLRLAGSGSRAIGRDGRGRNKQRRLT